MQPDSGGPSRRGLSEPLPAFFSRPPPDIAKTRQAAAENGRCRGVWRGFRRVQDHLVGD
jgi:hypothetical protein